MPGNHTSIISKLNAINSFRRPGTSHLPGRFSSEFTDITSLFGGHLAIVLSYITNCVTLIGYYYFIKYFNYQAPYIFYGYITIFRAYSEFISASICLIHGLVDVNTFHLSLGFFGVTIGFAVRVLYFLHKREQDNQSLHMSVNVLTWIHIFVVFTCSWVIHRIALASGIVPCVAGIVTRVFPLMVVSECIEKRMDNNFIAMMIVDMTAVCILWWYCAPVPLKYCVLVPSLVGLLLTLIERFSMKVTDVMSESG